MYARVVEVTGNPTEPILLDNDDVLRPGDVVCLLDEIPLGEREGQDRNAFGSAKVHSLHYHSVYYRHLYCHHHVCCRYGTSPTPPRCSYVFLTDHYLKSRREGLMWLTIDSHHLLSLNVMITHTE